MDAIKRARAAVRRRREQIRFDGMSLEERHRKTLIGENPYETDEVRAKKREAELERRKRDFDMLPEDGRKFLESIGASPYQRDKVVRRVSGSIITK